MPFLEIPPALSLTASLGKALPLKNFLFPSKENEIISFLFFPLSSWKFRAKVVLKI